MSSIVRVTTRFVQLAPNSLLHVPSQLLRSSETHSCASKAGQKYRTTISSGLQQTESQAAYLLRTAKATQQFLCSLEKRKNVPI